MTYEQWIATNAQAVLDKADELNRTHPITWRGLLATWCKKRYEKYLED